MQIFKLALPLVAFASFSAETIPPAGVLVHEWGTFTSVADRNGAPVIWNANSDPGDLPCFVVRSGRAIKSALSTIVRMETPVIYFYSPRPAAASVKVAYPKAHSRNGTRRPPAKETGSPGIRSRFCPAPIPNCPQALPPATTMPPAKPAPRLFAWAPNPKSSCSIAAPAISPSRSAPASPPRGASRSPTPRRSPFRSSSSSTTTTAKPPSAPSRISRKQWSWTRPRPHPIWKPP